MAPVVELQAVSVVSAASLLAGPVAPGALVTILGSGLGPDSGVNSAFDASGRMPTSLAGIQVLFDGVAAPLFYVQAGQLTAQAPYTLAGKTTTNVQVSYRNVVVGSASVAVTAAAPAIFPAVVNQDGSINLGRRSGPAWQPRSPSTPPELVSPPRSASKEYRPRRLTRSRFWLFPSRWREPRRRSCSPPPLPAWWGFCK